MLAVPSLRRAPEAAVASGGATILPLPATLDDASLVAGLREGRAHAARTFFERYGPLVQRVLARVMGPDEELGDLLHDVFVQALSNIAKLDDPAALRGWLTSIAVFSARQCIRRRSRRKWLRYVAPWDVPEPAAEQADEAESSEALRLTYAVLATLPADERIAFALRFVDGMPLDDVAGACGVSLATAKRRIARAQARFVSSAREHPLLDELIRGGSRWGDQ